MPLNHICCRCQRSKATQDMELICPAEGLCNLHTSGEQFKEYNGNLISAARCEDCIRYSICGWNERTKPRHCKFFDLKGDTPDIVRTYRTPKSRWRRINYGKS